MNPSSGSGRGEWSAKSSLALALVLLTAGVLRFSGLDWDEGTHLHPDERFLTMVETGLRLPESIGEYLDTSRSPLNPHNAGYTFFVYGTFPVFLVRYVAEWLAQVGYDEVHLVGRALSGVFDLVALALLYALGSRLYGRVVGLLAAALGAFTVLLLQHAHFFVVDPFANAFIVAGLYLAVRAQDEGRLWDYALFGVCVGAAMASKISAAPLAGVIVLALAARVLSADRFDREQVAWVGLWGVALAGVTTIVTFRFLQPYAFEGPALWNILPNPEWLADLREVSIQSSGKADLPFALQWANRPPILFAWTNMVRWGMGPPLGVVAWLSWGWALVESLRGRWHRHVVPLVWTGAYFLWQGVAFTSAMRYQLPVYPTLILFAAWGAVTLWKRAHSLDAPRRAPARAVVGLLGAVLFGAHAAYGIGFTRIYTTPVTRVAASRWIYRTIPAAINLALTVDGDQVLHPLPTPQDFLLGRGTAYDSTFRPEAAGALTGVTMPPARRLGARDGPAVVLIEIYDGSGIILTQARLVIPDETVERQTVAFEPVIGLDAERGYGLRLSVEGAPAVALEGGLELRQLADGAETGQVLALAQEEIGLGPGAPHLTTFDRAEGRLEGLRLGPARLLDPSVGPARLTAAVLDDPAAAVPLAVATTLWDAAGGDGPGPRLVFDTPIALDPARTYWLRTEVEGSPIAVRGSRIISESSWDDGLPLRLDGRDGYGGLYLGLNQELYWSDNEDTDADGRSDKLERIVGTLERGDYLVITSNRQYGSIPRVPVRYPLTTEYYRLLFDCPAPTPVHECAAVAHPSETVNALGYRLVRTFESHPRLGPLELNDQTAEEAFTVYDHPKVLIFERTPEFSRTRVEALLGAVDLSRIQHLIPADVGDAPPDLMLPPERLAEQRAGGSWSELFPRRSLVNRSQAVAAIAWWLLIASLGLVAFPIVRIVLPGFEVGGYALARTFGLLLLAWAVWFLGSLRIPFSRATIIAVLTAMAAVAALLALRDRRALADLLRRQRREVLVVEALTLGLFLLDLAIRFGNPDLWHPSKGGEKPMDFSYFNAVLRSTSFPPYDPWFAGGYINYYYFGFVVVGVPVRLLGLDPSVAYNLILPTLFALLGIGGYAVAVELVRRSPGFGRAISPRLAGAAAAAALVLLGNLGTVVMTYQGLKQLGSAGQPVQELIAGVPQALRGLGRFLTLQAPLPYRPDEWYWNPSRAIPAAPGDVDPITEFPFFTFLYADLHAHMISLPLTVLGLGWSISWALAASERRRMHPAAVVAALAAGGLILGSLRPTNTWDFPVYLGLGALACLSAPFLRRGRPSSRAAVEGLLAAAGLVAFFLALYQPFTHWYAQGYSRPELWDGSRTSLRAYLTVHGVFLPFLVAWMAWETVAWMESTPISALARLRRYLGTIAGVAVLLAALTVYAFADGVRAILIVMPLLVWSAVLLVRRNWPTAKRIVVLLTMTALALTLTVEVLRLVGDIGRMNTVFKFYLQVWTLFSIGAAAAFFWSWADAPAWHPTARTMWLLGGSLLVGGALLFPLTATPAKLRDRMAEQAPHTLDGMEFMKHATYYDQGGEMTLAEDYRAIRWLQDNVAGSPVIVEANVPEYRWGSRMTIYTGLPGVLGWRWHQQQQRPLVSGDPATARALELVEFYATPSVEFAASFLERYDVSYVVVGRLERLYFERLQPCRAIDGGARVECDMAGRPLGMRSPEVSAFECEPTSAEEPDRLSCPTHGLEKFERMAAEGRLREVFRDGMTVIYEVVR